MTKEIQKIIADTEAAYKTAKDKFYYELRPGSRPFHYLLFSGFKWYRRLVGGKWQRMKMPGYSWIRMKEFFLSDDFENEDWG